MFGVFQKDEHRFQHCQLRIFDLVILTIRVELLRLCLFIRTKRALPPAPFFTLELDAKPTVTAFCYAHELSSLSQQIVPSLFWWIAYHDAAF